MDFVPQRDESERSSVDRLEPCVDFDVAQFRGRSGELYFPALAVEIDDVLHAADAGTSSHTVSTCAVCGNMSNATSDRISYRVRRDRSRASVAGLQLT